MPVVINEFEVVTQPEESPRSAAPTQPVPAQPQVREIEQIVRRQLERAMRVRAY